MNDLLALAVIGLHGVLLLLGCTAAMPTATSTAQAPLTGAVNSTKRGATTTLEQTETRETVPVSQTPEPNSRRTRTPKFPPPSPTFAIGTPFPLVPSLSVQLPTLDLSNRIAYVDEGGLWIAKPDGSARQLIYTPPQNDRAGSIARFIWSPDGAKIAFFDGPRLVVTDLPSGTSELVYRAVQLYDFGFDRLDFRSPGVAWDPQNRAIAFVEGDRLSIAWLNTKKIDLLAQGAGYYPFQVVYYDDVEWTRDGKWILYRKWGGGPAYSSLVAISPGGSEDPRMLVPEVIDFALSPDGKWLAYGSAYDELRMVQASCIDEQSVPTCVENALRVPLPPKLSLTLSGESQGLSWSGDSTRLLINWNLLFDIETRELQRIDLGGAVPNGSRPLSPDGEHVVGSYGSHGDIVNTPLVIYDLESKTLRTFIEFKHGAKTREAAWSPK